MSLPWKSGPCGDRRRRKPEGMDVGVPGKGPGVWAWPVRVRVSSTSQDKPSLGPTGPPSLFPGQAGIKQPFLCSAVWTDRHRFDVPRPRWLVISQPQCKNWPGFLPAGHPPFVCSGRGNCRANREGKSQIPSPHRFLGPEASGSLLASRVCGRELGSPVYRKPRPWPRRMLRQNKPQPRGMSPTYQSSLTPPSHQRMWASGFPVSRRGN